jgi:hypothetical protein
MALRAAIVPSVLLAAGGCSLFLDFSGLTGGQTDGGAQGSDAPVMVGEDSGLVQDATASSMEGGGDAESTIDADAADGGAQNDATDALDTSVPNDSTTAADTRALDDAADASATDVAPTNGIYLVQKAGSHFSVSTKASQASEAFASPNTAGNSIVVLGFWAALGFTATVTDSTGNTYASTTVVTNPQQGALQIFYVARAAAGANTVTLTMSAGFNDYVGLAIFEYAGLAASNILEGTAGQYAPAMTASASTPPLVPSFPNSLLVAGFGDVKGSGVITPGPGWTSLVVNDQFYMLAEARIVSASTSISASAIMPTTDNGWVGLMAAFQGAP